MEGAELAALVSDITANGLIEPITVLDGMILDGRNRYHACIAAQVEPAFTPFSGDDPAAYVVSANLHRRHLSQEQKRDLIANLVKAQPEKSDRQIAKAAKVDHKTVGAARSALEATGEIPQLRETTGADGKSRKRTKRKVAREADSEGKPAPKEDMRVEVGRLADNLIKSDPDGARALRMILRTNNLAALDLLLVALDLRLQGQAPEPEQHDPFAVPKFLVRKPGLAS